VKLICETCRYHIGSFEPEDLSLPLCGDMFKPRAPGYPNPFLPGAGFLELMCPASMGGHRAMLREDAVMTSGGLYEIGGEVPKEPSNDPEARAAEERQRQIDAVWAEIEGDCEPDVYDPGAVDPEDAIFIDVYYPEERFEVSESGEISNHRFVCPDCGKELKTKGALGNHKRFCKGTK
jgi:hypothetical protein